MEMEEKNVPFMMYEGTLARFERSNRRLFIALVIAMILIVLSNIAWLWYYNQFDYYTDGYAVDIESGDGIASYIGERGIINAENYDTEMDEK